MSFPYLLHFLQLKFIPIEWMGFAHGKRCSELLFQVVSYFTKHPNIDGSTNHTNWKISLSPLKCIGIYMLAILMVPSLQRITVSLSHNRMWSVLSNQRRPTWMLKSFITIILAIPSTKSKATLASSSGNTWSARWMTCVAIQYKQQNFKISIWNSFECKR